MSDLKVSIGGRHYTVSCNSGEEEAATESANLLNQEADSIQDQLGRLSEEKMLLLSGLMLGDKIRTLRQEKNVLEETLRITQSKLNELNLKADESHSKQSNVFLKHQELPLTNNEENHILFLENISELLDMVIREAKPSKQVNDEEPTSVSIAKNAQDSFL